MVTHGDKVQLKTKKRLFLSDKEFLRTKAWEKEPRCEATALRLPLPGGGGEQKEEPEQRGLGPDHGKITPPRGPDLEGGHRDRKAMRLN